MKKILFAFVALAFTIPNFAGAQPERHSCVVQVQKKDTLDARANFIIACGSETLLSYWLPPFANMSATEVSRKKLQFLEILRGLVRNSSNVTCIEQDTELFWFGICHK